MVVAAALRRAGPRRRRGVEVLATLTGREMERWTLPAPVRPRRARRRRQLRRARRLRHHRGRHRAGAPGAGLRRRRPRDLPRATACRWSTRSAPTATSRPTLAARRRRSSSRTPTSALVADLRRPRPAVPPRALRAHLPALLALPHAAHVLRAAVLVRPHDRDQGPAAGRERGRRTGSRRPSSTVATATGWTTTSTGRCPATGTGARRCRSGATTPTRPGWSASARWPSCASCPAVTARLTRTGRSSMTSPSPVPGEAGTYRRVAAGDRRLVRLGLDAVRPVRRARIATPSWPAAAYPADFICEAIDQTRGWFYTLMAVGTLVFDQSRYRNVLCLGHILAEDGRKMSKHLGNILEPIPLMDRPRRRRAAVVHALRRVAVVGTAGRAQGARRDRLQGAADLLVDRVLPVALRPGQRLVTRRGGRAGADATALDRWALSRAHDRRRRGRRGAGGLRHRARRQAPGRATSTTCRTGTSGARAAGSGTATRPRSRTLHECLHILTRLLAPFVPFVTERVWTALFADGRPASTRCTWRRWPVADDCRDRRRPRTAQVGLVRRLVELGRAARAESGVKTRQPLARALISAPGWAAVSPDPAAGGRGGAQRRRDREPGRRRRAGRAVGASRTSAPWAAGSASGPRRSPPRSPPPIRPRSSPRYRAGGGVGRRRRRAGRRSAADDVVVSETPRSGWAVASRPAPTPSPSTWS